MHLRPDPLACPFPCPLWSAESKHTHHLRIIIKRVTQGRDRSCRFAQRERKIGSALWSATIAVVICCHPPSSPSKLRRCSTWNKSAFVFALPSLARRAPFSRPSFLREEEAENQILSAGCLTSSRGRTTTTRRSCYDGRGIELITTRLPPAAV